MFIRFVTNEIHPDSGRRLGVLHALRYLRDEEKLLAWEQDRADEIAEWFSRHLERPTSFNRSSRSNRLEKALSWFKDGATDHIVHMREISGILESHGLAVEILTTDRPGCVTHENEHQIVAEPFSDTPT